MEWVRRWRYELGWAPEHRGGVLSRDVETIAQLRAVVAWARAHPHVIRYSFRPVDYLEGTRAVTCSAGHRLEAPDPRQTYRLKQDIRRYGCRGCPGHDVTACPTCGELVIEPPPGHSCAAVRHTAPPPDRQVPGRAGAAGRPGKQPGGAPDDVGHRIRAQRVVGPGP